MFKLKEELKEKIIFTNEDDEINYEKFISIRGLGVYSSVYNALVLYIGHEKISYKDFSTLIRYDKGLRDILYVYLGTLEEYIREQVWMQLEYKNNKIIHKFYDDLNACDFIKTDTYGFNFYQKANLDFGSIILIINFYKLNIKCPDSQLCDHLENIRILRNKVMHHNFILIDASKTLTKQNILENLSQIEHGIISLSYLLPTDYKENFLNGINKLTYYHKDGQLRFNSKYIKLKYFRG